MMIITMAITKPWPEIYVKSRGREIIIISIRQVLKCNSRHNKKVQMTNKPFDLWTGFTFALGLWPYFSAFRYPLTMLLGGQSKRQYLPVLTVTNPRKSLFGKRHQNTNEMRKDNQKWDIFRAFRPDNKPKFPVFYPRIYTIIYGNQYILS